MGAATSRLLRFADLKEARICENWPRLRRLVDDYGFPPGFLLSPGCRVFDAAEVEAWLEARRSATVRQDQSAQTAA